MEEQFHIEVLRDKYQRIQARNPSYSLRAFARSIEIDPSSLSKILNAQRNIPTTSLSKVLRFLNLEPKEEKVFLKSISNFKPLKQKIRHSTNMPIILDEITYKEIIENWEYYAILNIVELDNFIPTTQHISHRLGLEESQANEMVNLLIQVNLLELCPNKKWKRTYKTLTTTNNKTSLAIKNAHKQELQLAIQALYDFPTSETGFYSATVQTNKVTINRIKEKCFNFLKTKSGEAIYFSKGQKVVFDPEGFVE